MRMVSKFTDYYDYLIHQYGVDEKIFYHRRIDEFYAHNNTKLKTFPYIYWEWGSMNRHWIGLAICGKYYMLSLVKVGEGVYYGHDQRNKYALVPYDPTTRKRNPYTQGQHFKVLDEVSKEIKQPVFLFNYDNYRTHDPVIQVFDFLVPLASLGIQQIIPAEQIYQDIQYYIANVINDGIDIRPPTEVANKDKILQAGFDLKQSFRHRSKT